MMKKLILIPKKDTITICLPPDWVGKPMVCILKDPYEMEEEEVVAQVSEAALCYHLGHKRKAQSSRRLRKRGLRRRRRNV